MAAVSLFWNTNIAAVTSCENALYSSILLIHAEVLPFQREGVKALINLCIVIHRVPCYLYFCDYDSGYY